MYDLRRKAWKIEAHVGYTDMMNNGRALLSETTGSNIENRSRQAGRPEKGAQRNS